MHTQRPGTDFAQFTHPQLVTMLGAGRSDSLRSAADVWDSTGRTLHDQASTLSQKLVGFDQLWQGGAGQAYQKMITDLATGLHTVATTAAAVRDLAHDAAEALDTAQAQMPAPSAVPTLPGATVALATTPLPVEGLSQAQVTVLLQRQTAAAAALRAQQQAQQVSDTAHARAVQVMTTLARRYAVDTDAVPTVPDAAPTSPAPAQGSVHMSAVSGSDPGWGHTTLVGADGVPLSPGTDALPQDALQNGSGLQGFGTAALQTAVTGPATVGPSASSGGLFGDLLHEGLLAAGGVFPLAKVPALVSRKAKDTAPALATGSATAAKAALPPAASLAGGGAGMAGGGSGGGFGAGSIGGLPATPTPAPTAFTGLAGTPAATPDAAAAALGTTPASGSSSSGMVGGMPMGMGAGMGAGADGGGRRIPAWLVETENVWGESSAVSPTIIGGE